MRSHAPCSCRDSTPISTTASAAVPTPSRSTKTVSKRPSAFRRRSSSRTKLVLPIRRCAVSNVWVPFRTRSVSTSSSASRSKKRSPSTQFDPAFFNPAITFPNVFVASNNVCKRICCQVRPHRSWLPAAPSELLHQRGRPIPREQPPAVARDVRRPGRSASAVLVSRSGPPAPRSAASEACPSRARMAWSMYEW